MHCNFALGKLRTYTLQIFMLLSISQPLIGAALRCPLIWQLILLFSVLCFVFYLFLVLIFFPILWMLITISSFHGKIRFSVAAVTLTISLIAIGVCNTALHEWHFDVLLCGQKACNNAFYLMFRGCLHDCIQQLYFL